MDTPICDFVTRYLESDPLRAHMPGHKGVSLTGLEPRDLTEIAGADSLYEANGIIWQSEQNAGTLFGAETFYSTEGSSQCIRAMLYLVALYAQKQDCAPKILAARNAHKTFLSAAALCDLDVTWLTAKEQTSYLSCVIDAETVEAALKREEMLPAAVYLTSPDYLGNITPIAPIAEVCHRYGVLLVVDNAHGAYLKFLPESCHPVDQGADICCDSAHKTLPALTGAAYLHIAHDAPEFLRQQAKTALAMFGSTSPSYLILQSLDAVNGYLADGYRERLAAFICKTAALKSRLTAHGYTLCGQEPTKLVIDAKAYGYTGEALAEILLESRIAVEFADPDFLVMMVTPETGEEGLARLEAALCAIPRREALLETPPAFSLPERAMSIRQAAMSLCETVEVAESLGRVLAAATVGCPPAVPIVACGERIDEAALRCFAYYGIDCCTVVIE